MYGLKNGQRERQKCNLGFHRNHPRRKLKTSRTRKLLTQLASARSLWVNSGTFASDTKRKKRFFFLQKLTIVVMGKYWKLKSKLGRWKHQTTEFRWLRKATKETSEFSNDKQKKTLRCFNSLQSFHSFFTQPKTKQSQAERKQKKSFWLFFFVVAHDESMYST
jgi:hypothetical protein